MRSVLNDAEADRALLQKARRALQAELESIKLDHVDANKMSSETELQKLRLKKQDLERALEEQEDRVTMTLERMKKAETYWYRACLHLRELVLCHVNKQLPFSLPFATLLNKEILHMLIFFDNYNYKRRTWVICRIIRMQPLDAINMITDFLEGLIEDDKVESPYPI